MYKEQLLIIKYQEKTRTASQIKSDLKYHFFKNFDETLTCMIRQNYLIVKKKKNKNERIKNVLFIDLQSEL